MPVNFDLNDLYAFRALVEYGNFRVAAESICLSQSALSRRIEKLEAALGNRLFERTTRRVALTLYGQNFAERSAQLLDSVESMLADVDKASEERTGLIAVAAVPSAACYFMPDVIRRFQSRYPRVRIKLIDSSAGNVIDAVARSQADFGICFRSQRLVIGHVRFRLFQRFLVTRLVDGEQNLIFFHQLVIVNVNRRDKTGHVRGDGHHIGAEACITRPR